MLKKILHGKKLLFSGIFVVAVTIIALIRINYYSRFAEVPPQRGNITEAIYGIGTVISHEVFDQKLGIMSRIRQLYVGEGSQVNRGDKMLITEEGVLFSAPFSGTVTRLYFNSNEIVMPGSIILRLVNLKNTYISVGLDQESAIRVRKGQSAQLSFESIRGKVIQGKVTHVYPSGGSFLVHVEVENMPQEILPDMTADVAIQVASRENVLMIPLASIQKGIARIKREGRTQKVKVNIGIINNQWAEILDDSVKESDMILVERK
ncbi:MAG: efflux RND transporter periplasmic adaptor subunit [Leptospiraceae bacterium]|nr:efflux RND transporter periplasmic adaptor subunit [Leptospiraceae bacterium]